MVLFFLVLWANTGLASEVRVLAPASLTDVLLECGRQFETSTGQPAPLLGFAGSSTLARQVQAGAKADVVLTADPLWMDVLAEDGLLFADSRTDLLRNDLVLVVPKDAWKPRYPSALRNPALKHLAIAGEAVPAGRRAREVLRRHRLLGPLGDRLVISTHVRATLALVVRHEVDAAIVYGSDARSSEAVEVGFVFDAVDHSAIRYPLALTTRGAKNPSAVRFYDYLRSPEAAQIFVDGGFGVLVNAPLRTHERPAWLGQLDEDEGWGPLLLSLWVGSLSLVLSLPIGIALGWLLARREFYGKTLVTILTMSPLVLPPVVTGFLLLRLFGRNGWFAPILSTLGLEVAFTHWGAVIAAAVVGFPLLVQLVRQAFEAVDPRYEQMAQTLGRHPLEAFATITLPLALPGIAAGAVLAFTRALGEFGATAILAGDVPGETRTLALALFSRYETPGQEGAAMELVWVSVALCAVALAAYELLTRLQKRRLEL